MVVALVIAMVSVAISIAFASSNIPSNAAPRIGGGEVQTADELDGDYAYINYASVIGAIDGSAPFDADDERGNDSSNANGIVRSFDQISYDIEYSVDTKDDSPYAYVRNGRVGIRAVLPCSSNEAAFAVDDMGWLDKTSGYEPEVTTDTIDGKECQVLIGYRKLVPSSNNPTVIPGQGTVKLIINVLGAKNGSVISPTVQMFAEHNSDDEYADVTNVPDTKVSAAPKYDIEIQSRGNRNYGRGSYDFSTGTDVAIDKEVGEANGAIAMFVIGFRNVNDNASKGKKGLEFPSSDYTFHLSFDTKVKAYDSSTWQRLDGYESKIWTWYRSSTKNDASKVVGRAANANGQYWTSNEVMPNSSGGGKQAVKQSGNMTMRRVSKSDVECTVNGMEYDINSFPTGYNGYDNKIPANVFYMSTFTVMVFLPFENLDTGESLLDELNTSDADVSVSMSDLNLKAVTSSGEPISTDIDGVGNQGVQTNDTAGTVVNVKKPGTFSAHIFYTRNYGVTSGVDMKSYIYNYGNGYDTLPLGYSQTPAPAQIAFGFGYGQFEEPQMPVYAETLVKFDPTRISIGTVPDKYTIKSQHEVGAKDKSRWSCTVQFGVKSNGSIWESEDEQNKTDWTDLVWYDTKDEAEKHGTIVAFNGCFRTPTDDSAWGSDYIKSYMPFTVTDDMDKVNSVAPVVARSRLWRRSTVKTQAAEAVDKNPSELTFSDYQTYALSVEPYTSDTSRLPAPNTTYAHDVEFVKTRYNENGAAANQTGNQLNGDSLLLTAEQSSIKRTVSQKVGTSPKSVYDIDYGERYVDIELRPSTSLSMTGADESSSLSTTITITDTLPSGMSYVAGSCYQGGSYSENTPNGGTVVGGKRLEPDVKSNDDGTTTLTWIIENVTVNSPIDPIRYVSVIGTQDNPDTDVVNNQELSGTATISSTYDRRQKHINNNNLSTYAIRVSKLRQSNLTISVSPRFNEMDAKFSYISNIGNYGTNAIADAYGICVLPNEANSSFSGSYAVTRISVNIGSIGNISDIELYATTDSTIINSDPNDIGLDAIRSEWTRITLSEDGQAHLPETLSGMTAWCVVKGSLSPNERVQVSTEISPSGNASMDQYTATMSDGKNTVQDTAYVVERSVSGIVFIDENSNSMRDDGEKPFIDVTVQMVDEFGSPIELVDGSVASMPLKEDGSYSFVGVPSGRFDIVFRESENGAFIGYTAAEANKDGVPDDVDSDAIPTYGRDTWLDEARISDVSFPEIESMTSNVFSVEHADLGIVTGTPHISIVKDVDSRLIQGDDAVAGTLLNYTMTIENDGEIILDNVRIDDPLVDSNVVINWSTSSDKATGEGSLSIGETVEATATYELTQTDIDAGHVNNIATAIGTSPLKEEVTDSDDVNTDIVAEPSIDIVKDVDEELLSNDEAVPGNVLNYSFMITNDGHVTLHEVSLTDELDGIYDVRLNWGQSTDNKTFEGTLSPGETVTGTAKYKVRQSDIDSGEVTNVAHVSGISPQDETVTDEDDAKTEIERSPAISLDKDTDDKLISGDDAVPGTAIGYDFEIVNIGNVTLHNVRLQEHMGGVYDLAIDWGTSNDGSTGNGSLAPNERVLAHGKYDITQEDIDAASVTNTATAYGTPPVGDEIADDDDVTTTIEQSPSISVIKDVDQESVTGDDAVAGHTLGYSFTVTNDGNVTLHDVDVEDYLEGVYDVQVDWDGSTDGDTDANALSVGESVAGTARYDITKKDIDAGAVTNVIGAFGKSPLGESVDAQDDASTVIEQRPSLSLEKDVDIELLEGDDVRVGAELKYSFKVTNTGNVTLSDVHINDELDGIGNIEFDWASVTDAEENSDGNETDDTIDDNSDEQDGQDGEPDASEGTAEDKTQNDIEDGVLGAGESVSGTASYIVTQDDIDAGKVLNTAQAFSVDTNGNDVPSNESTALTDIKGDVLLLLDKQVDKERIDPAQKDDTITYTFVVTNESDVTLRNLSITDELEGMSEIRLDWDGSTDESTPENVLSVGESVTGTAVYNVTDDDIDRGVVDNVAIAHMESDSLGTVDSNEDMVETVLVTPEPIVTPDDNDDNGVASDIVEQVLTQTGANSGIIIGVMAAGAVAASAGVIAVRRRRRR